MADRTSTSSSSSTKLQRRLMALPRRQWSTDIDLELISHVSATNDLSDVAQLSDCLTKMAEHMRALPAHEQPAMLAGLLETPSQMQELCSATAFALQQLSEGVQQYQQQGQLPAAAALTAHAVDGCNALCMTLISVLDFSAKPPIDVPFIQRRHRFKAIVQNTGRHNSSQHELRLLVGSTARSDTLNLSGPLQAALITTWCL
jgi:hypothetical protein